jgi:hypothetical protein
MTADGIVQGVAMPGKCPCDRFMSSPRGRYICVCNHISSEHRQNGLTEFATFGECGRLLRPGEPGYAPAADRPAEGLEARR